MKMFTSIRQLVAASFALFAVLLTVDSAHATHFRYGTISWEVADPAEPNVVTFRIETAWRRSYPIWSSPTSSPQLGQTVLSDASLVIPGAPARQMSMVISSIHPAEDWMVGVTEFTHAFPNTAAIYRVGFQTCCRISTLAGGNNDRPFLVYADVVIDPANPILRSPRATSVPLIHLAVNQPASIWVPSVQGTDGPSTFSVAPPASPPGSSTGSGLVQGAPPGFALSADGEITWTPTASGLYAVQVLVHSPRGAVIPLDVLFNVQAFGSGVSPSLEIDGSIDPTNFTVQPGETITFDVTGMDDDTDPVTGLPSIVMLASGALPTGATLLPSLPASGRSPFSTLFSWTPTLTQGGSHVIAFTATDDTGRQTLNSAMIHVNRAPLISCSAPATVEASSASGVTANVRATVEDPDGDELTLDWTIEGEVVQSDTIPAGTSPIEASSSATFGLGAHSVNVTVTDSSGASASCLTSVEVVDTTPAEIPPLPDLTVEAEGPDGASAHWLTPPAQDVVSGTLTVGCLPGSGSLFPLGSSTVTCSAVDDAGNIAVTTFQVQVVDTTPPVVTPPADLVVEAEGPETTVSFVAAALDLVSGSVLATCTPPSGSGFTVGPHAILCTAEDAAGNLGVAGFVVTVIDTTPPDITRVPADQLLEATGPDGAMASFALPVANDLVDGEVAVTCSHAAGDTFPLGVTVISCSASDSHDNTSAVAFIVEVEDTTPPVLNVPADVTSASCQGQGVVSIGAASATDDVLTPLVTGEVISTNGVLLTPPIPVVAGQVSLGVGIHVVRWTATDGLNPVSAIQTIVVGTSIQARESFLVGDRGRVLSYGGGFAAVLNSGAGQTRLGNDAQSGSVFSVGPVNLLSRSTVNGNVTSANTVSRSPDSRVTGSVTQRGSVVLPNLPALPAFPSPSAASFTLNSGTQSRAPGSYSDVTLNGGTLNLTAGDYFFRNLTINSSVTIRVTPSTRVFVQNSFAFRSPFRASSGTAVQPITLGFAGANLVVETNFDGTLIAPNAFVAFGIGSGVTYTGAFYGRTLEVRPGSTLVCRN